MLLCTLWQRLFPPSVRDGELQIEQINPTYQFLEVRKRIDHKEVYARMFLSLDIISDLARTGGFLKTSLLDRQNFI